MKIETDEWYSLSDAARDRKRTPQTMSYLVGKEKIKSIKIGDRIIIVKKSDIRKFIPDKGGRRKAKDTRRPAPT